MLAMGDRRINMRNSCMHLVGIGGPLVRSSSNHGISEQAE